MHKISNDNSLWEPQVEGGLYIVPEMEHYRCHKACIPKTRAEQISDTVESPTKTFHMPQISSMDATYHSTQDLIYALNNPAHEIPLVKTGHGHK